MYVTAHKYTPDFTLYGKRGKVIYIECKGRFSSEDRAKMLAVRDSNPTIDLRFLFQREQPIRKGSRTTYLGWCDKHGFLGAVGTSIPEEWLKELNK